MIIMEKALSENIDSNVKYCNFSGEKFHNIYQNLFNIYTLGIIQHLDISPKTVFYI